jgi:hypothetical protein
MHDQRIPVRALLRGKDAFYRSRIEGIRAEAVDRLSRKCDSAASTQNLRGASDLFDTQYFGSAHRAACN